jgi:hypothetical protein
VRRLYRLEGLQVWMRVRRGKHMALHRGLAPIPASKGGQRQLYALEPLQVQFDSLDHLGFNT